MHEQDVTVAATMRCRERKSIREARGVALAALLGGAKIAPSLVDTTDRQRMRARLLERLDLSDRIGDDPEPTTRLLEMVIGTDDTLPRRFLPLGEIAAKAVGRIVVGDRRTGRFGTGSLVAPQLVMTNNHVLDSQASAGNAVIELGYYEVTANTVPTAYQAFRLRPDTFFYTSEDLDFTLCAVEQNNGRATTSDYGYLELMAESGKALTGERVNIIQHAGGKPQTLSIRENTIVDVFDQYLHYAADTSPGSSGAPVFNDAWQLVGLHHASVPSDSNGGYVNEGIRTSAIMQKLNQVFASAPG